MIRLIAVALLVLLCPLMAQAQIVFTFTSPLTGSTVPTTGTSTVAGGGVTVKVLNGYSIGVYLTPFQPAEATVTKISVVKPPSIQQPPPNPEVKWISANLFTLEGTLYARSNLNKLFYPGQKVGEKTCEKGKKDPGCKCYPCRCNQPHKPHEPHNFPPDGVMHFMLIDGEIYYKSADGVYRKPGTEDIPYTTDASITTPAGTLYRQPDGTYAATTPTPMSTNKTPLFWSPRPLQPSCPNGRCPNARP